MKSTQLLSTAILLPCLIFIRLVHLLSPETISCTLGLHHLSYSSPVPSCSPCFNVTTTANGTGSTPCFMVTTLDHFSNYFFWPLLILGTWCLFEEIAMCCKSTSWFLPYSWTEAPWLMEDAEEFFKSSEWATISMKPNHPEETELEMRLENEREAEHRELDATNDRVPAR